MASARSVKDAVVTDAVGTVHAARTLNVHESRLARRSARRAAAPHASVRWTRGATIALVEGLRSSFRSAGYVRRRRGRVLAGVCAGLGDAWGVNRWLVRLAAVLSIVLPGPQVLAYVVLWILMPED
jgi:phage shock protein PspC (stress-responsive transcriptional regulator)